MRSAASKKKRGPPEPLAHVVGVDGQGCRTGAVRGDPGGDLAQQPAQLALERANPRLTGVVPHDDPKGIVGDVDLVGAQGRPLQLATDQMVAGDRHLLVLGVAVETDDLHPVEQRPGDGVDHVGGGDEQDLGQVQLDLEIVVAEGVVLRRVEHLEQGRGRVSPVVGAQLVHLVEDDHRVHGPGLAQGAHQPTGLGTHVGPAMATDLGLVADTSQRHPDEGASEGTGHRLAQRGLADPGGPDQGQDGARATPADRGQAPLGLQLAHGQVLEDAILHVVAGRHGPRRGCATPRPRRAGPRTARPRGARTRCPARSGSTRARGSARSSARACRSRGRPPCARPRADPCPRPVSR